MQRAWAPRRRGPPARRGSDARCVPAPAGQCQWRSGGGATTRIDSTSRPKANRHGVGDGLPRTEIVDPSSTQRSTGSKLAPSSSITRWQRSLMLRRRAVSPVMRPYLRTPPSCASPGGGCCFSKPKRLLSTVLSSTAAADPIFALSSAPGVAAIAVFRLSGQGLEAAAQRLLRHPNGTSAALPRPRMAAVRHVVHPVTGELLDEGLALWFPGPHSFTGEDMLELHVHGSRAVSSLVHDALASVGGGMRQAHAGEFSLRAFENGKIDLTQAEGLSDLLAAETTVQHRQAVVQALGGEGATLRSLYDGWRADLSRHLARIEAGIDFVEEEIDGAKVLSDSVPAVTALRDAMSKHANQGLRGERSRLGLRVTLAGAPNAGKSALLNALVGRPAAIVNETAGTTRDVVEVNAALPLGDPSSSNNTLSSNEHIGGSLPVVLSDTAGARMATEAVEAEGVRRATERWAASDLRLLVVDVAAISTALVQALTMSPTTRPTAEAIDTQGHSLVPMVSDLLDAGRVASSFDAAEKNTELNVGSTHWNIGIVLNKSDMWSEVTGDSATFAVQNALQNPETLSRALCRIIPELERLVCLPISSDTSTATRQSDQACQLPLWVVSCATGEGVDDLSRAIAANAKKMLTDRQYSEGGGAEGEAGMGGVSGSGSSDEGEAAIPTRARHRVQLHAALDALDAFLVCSNNGAELELAAEEMRIAVQCMGRLTGAVSVEDLLDVIFKEFCVGK